MQELEFAVGLDQQQPVGLGDTARDLRQELGAGDADRDRQADPLAHLGSQPAGDVDRFSGDPPQAAHVEEGLVDRQPLDDRRRVVEHLEHRLAGLRVGLEAGRHDDEIRAHLARLELGHRCVHTEALGLVAGGEHDAAAHDDGTVAQPRIVALLDRGVERVEVGVQDRRLLGDRTTPHRTYVRRGGGPSTTRHTERVTTPDVCAGEHPATGPESDTELASRLAAEAGVLLMELRHDLHRQGMPRWDVMDHGDAASHRFIADELRAHRPDDAVLDEEGVEDPRRFEADRVWIIDPLDGTREYGEETPSAVRRTSRPRAPR